MTTRIPIIAPVPDGQHRPRWTIAVPTWNPDPNYLRQTLRSILDAQLDPDTQILVVDDGSTTPADVRTLVTEAQYARLEIHQTTHGGIAQAWNACLTRSRGHWIHLLHQDDLVSPGFYEQMFADVQGHPTVALAACQPMQIDSLGRPVRLMSALSMEVAGIVDDWVEHVYVQLHFQTPGVAVARRAYEEVGGFDESFQFALDWDMWRRIARRHPIFYDPEPLASYRRHTSSASWSLAHSGTSFAETERCIAASESELPPEFAKGVERRSRVAYTRILIMQAWEALALRQPRLALATLRAAIAMSDARTTLAIIRERIGNRIRSAGWGSA